MDISASALTAHRTWMDVIAGNLANAESTRTGQAANEPPVPYRRQLVIFTPQGDQVQVAAIRDDPTGFRQRYEPGHPDANAQGYVTYPNVNPVQEMVDMISATRAYEANTAALNGNRAMLLQALEIGRA
jgi:flagellar basal-body rod protein FlgC